MFTGKKGLEPLTTVLETVILPLNYFPLEIFTELNIVTKSQKLKRRSG
jgi:hypothetical protein